MKIAILAPVPVPYERGAAERLWWALARHLNEETRHQAEFVKLPCAAHDAREIVRAYQAFSELDLAGFDAVISGQHAAWMARHSRHVCWFIGPLQGLHPDLDAAARMPEVAGHAGLAALVAYLGRYRGSPSAAPEFFARWSELAAPGNAPERAFDVRGPLAGAAIRWLDEIALGAGRIARHAAISGPASRHELLPDGVPVAVARPPIEASRVPGDRFEHFLAPARGDAEAEKIDAAMRRVRTRRALLRLSGEEDEDARDAASRDALAAVVASPGGEAELHAIEAASWARPAIVEETADGLAAAMQRLADAPQEARASGLAAREAASRASWPEVVETLFTEVSRAAPTGARRRKLLLGVTFGIHPPRHGGQSRIYHLFRALAPDFETVIVSLCGSNEPPFEGEIAPGVREVRVPLSPEHERRAHELAQAVGASVIDVTMPELHGLTPELARTLEREAADACAAIASHPFMHPALAPLGLPIWYEAQDFELELKGALFAGKPGGEALVESVRAVESETARTAEVILCASPEDAANLVKVYGVDPARILDVPNGTDAGRIVFTQDAAREGLRERLGLAGAPPVAMFMGSGHWPNIEAGKRVLEFAAALPHVAFLLMGSASYAFDPARVAPNVLLLGEVDDVTRNLCLQACDAALNPMEHGSGTNLKMLDFFAAGLPAVSTERGARGWRLQDERECLVRAIADFPAAIDAVVGSGRDEARARARRARDLVEREFDWDAIARRVKPRLLEAASR